MILATGGDSRFARCLHQLLRSLPRAGERPEEIRVYDLGLTEEDRASLIAGHPEIRLLPVSWEGLPDFVRPQAGTYAWKPVILAALAEEVAAPFLWLDSATVVLKPLTSVRDQVDRTGLWVPLAGGVAARSHPRSAAYLTEAGLDPVWQTRRSRAAGVCAFDPRVPAVLALLRRWRELAMVEECIAPPGIGPKQHDFDQTIFNALLYDGRARGEWELGTDELAISAHRAVDFLMARVRTPTWVPLWLDRLVVSGFRIRRAIDLLQWRVRRIGTPQDDPEDFVRP